MLYNTQINMIYRLLQITLTQATNQGSLLFWDTINIHNSNNFCTCIHEYGPENRDAQNYN